jgi:hypothetical protein
VISCVLSDETEKIARKLVYAFVVDNLPKPEMKKLIESLVKVQEGKEAEERELHQA